MPSSYIPTRIILHPTALEAKILYPFETPPALDQTENVPEMHIPQVNDIDEY